jgi:hypothetical protein
MPNIQEKREPWLVRLLAGVFSAVPLGLADLLLALASKVKRSWFQKTLFALSFVVSVMSALSFNRVLDLLQLFFLSDGKNQAEGTALRLGLFYLLYVVVSLPVFLVVAYLGSHEKLFKGGSSKREPGKGRMRYQRYKSTHKQVYLGDSFLSPRPLLFKTSSARCTCR